MAPVSFHFCTDDGSEMNFLTCEGIFSMFENLRNPYENLF